MNNFSIFEECNDSLPSKASASIAIVPWGRLGDGVIFLILAENFRRAGYRVSYYSNAVYQMRHWLPQLEILPAPIPDQRHDLVAQHDIVINDICSPLVAGLSEQERAELASKTVSISTVDALPEHLRSPGATDGADSLLLRQPGLRKVLSSGGVIRGEKTGNRSMVDYAVEYCRDRCGLSDSCSYIALTPPAGIQHRCHSRRVAILPTTDAKKEYSPEKFIKVARELRRQDCDPHFIVLPEQVQKWRALAAPYPVHSFTSIDELATFIYESGVTLSNDSGGGHLASMLGVPTVTIYRKQGYFEYRPGWGQGVVVRPRITPKILGKRIWMPFLRSSDVAKSCLQQLTTE